MKSSLSYIPINYLLCCWQHAAWAVKQESLIGRLCFPAETRIINCTLIWPDHFHFSNLDVESFILWYSQPCVSACVLRRWPGIIWYMASLILLDFSAVSGKWAMSVFVSPPAKILQFLSASKTKSVSKQLRGWRVWSQVIKRWDYYWTAALQECTDPSGGLLNAGEIELN